ncbi:MAG: hypothetical protein MMC33_004897 [Icmadophila ericetorum]|nr:hypothetical protein [Icmadophila ericetorum]
MTSHIFDAEGDLAPILPTKGTNEISEPLRMRVSSKHLSLASPVFKDMLSRNFFEGITLHTIGSVEVLLSDNDTKALIVLLSIIRSQPSKIPSKVNLDFLTEMTILVDKYQLRPVAALLSGYWIAALKHEIPSEWGEATYQAVTTTSVDTRLPSLLR